MRALELFCGIGGFAAALARVAPEAEVVGALDLSPHALATYQHNFPAHPARQLNLTHLPAARYEAYGADLWWMSPPCQPYTGRGLQRDIEDRRAQSLLRLIEVIPQVRPRHLAMENVAGFGESQARQLLLQALAGAGYEVAELYLCPTELGVPNRRPRYYLAASLEGVRRPQQRRAPVPVEPLRDYLDEGAEGDEALRVSPKDLARHGQGMRVLDAWHDEEAVANCFTGAYGKTFQASGAYVRCLDGGVRWFSPGEVLGLLHFPGGFGFGPETTLRQSWKQAGNSLSVVAVEEVLRMLPLQEAG